MSHVNNPHTQILTEAGTNELELLVFHLNNGRYGVNVAKVREIITPQPLTRVPYTHAAVDGVFRLRQHVYPLVNLRRFFNMPTADPKDGRVIVAEFNDTRLGFLVDQVERIHRISWKKMAEVPWTSEEQDPSVTSVAHIDDHMVLMLDFERIAFRIAGVEELEKATAPTASRERGDYRILLADDSPMMRRMLSTALRDAAFGDVRVVNNGQEAWDALDHDAQRHNLPDAVVTDIEMPLMDGLHLTKRIKEDPRLKHVPVVVFSSLVSDDNLKKCKAVGADRQLTKPQLPRLVEILDELLAARAAAVATA
ncbi:MAG: chemotaxis protein [Phycisphaerae bacterium]